METTIYADWLEANPSIKLSFNPGSHQFKADPKTISRILEKTYIVFINREEAQKITNFSGSSQQKEKELINAVHDLGPKIVVITDGGNGSFIGYQENFFRCGILPIDAYERTGAGDAFSSGCLSAIIKGKTLEEALLWGTMNSSSVIGYVGPQRGLLTESDMQIWLDRAKSAGLTVEKLA